jgi:hypothetical protein
MLSFRNTEFSYEPYPIGVSSNVLEPSIYDRLVASFPPKALFEFKPSLGNKYSLSEVNNATQYHDFVRSSSNWREFHTYIKDQSFIAFVLDMLRQHFIDLSPPAQLPARTLPAKVLQRLLRTGLTRLRSDLSARFEFSMLPAHGGFIKPHTDAPQKIVTLVISMLRPDEWNSGYGGGTDVMKPRDIRQNYNHLNRYLEFDEVETLGSYPYVPNQCVVFIKTFNSLHAVRPMTGPKSDLMRRTLTINIERSRVGL